MPLAIASLALGLLSGGCSEGVLTFEGQPNGVEEDQVPLESPPESGPGFSTIREIPLEPVEIVCLHRSETPMLATEALEEGFLYPGTLREEDLDEEDEGLDTEHIEAAEDYLEFSASRGEPHATATGETATRDFVFYFNAEAVQAFLAGDSDGDCLPNGQEFELGTEYDNPDTDGDGWYDGPCNERRRLYVTYVKAHDEQEDMGDDELYFVALDVRYPHSDLDDYWNFDDGDSRSMWEEVAVLTRGTNLSSQLRNVRLEAWEDDFEVTNTWTPDDLLFEIDIDLGAYNDGDTFSVRRVYDDWDYEVHFEVDVELFADPLPLADADLDGDGIRDSAEFAVARDFGGITDPAAQDILVEVDWMHGHYLRTQAKRLVATQLHRHGYRPYIHRHQQLSSDGCLTRTEARNLYNNYFTFGGYRAFRYAVMTEVLWNDASGVAIGDTFFMDDSTWWINGGVLAQGGTLIHELGHTLGLNKTLFHLIDTIAWFSYDSAMNYTFQATMVDYSNNGAGGSSNDHDDWAAVDPSYGMQYSFGLSTDANNGVCD